jgi:hypothetical protein
VALKPRCHVTGGALLHGQARLPLQRWQLDVFISADAAVAARAGEFRVRVERRVIGCSHIRFAVRKFTVASEDTQAACHLKLSRPLTFVNALHLPAAVQHSAW